MRFIFIFFFSISVFSQNKSIEVKIESIITDDSNLKERRFTISYHIENLTTNTLSFFFKPDALIPNASSSLSLHPVYKIYQNHVFQNVERLFHTTEMNGDWQKLKELEKKDSVAANALMEKMLMDYQNKIKKQIDNYKKSGGNSTDELWILKNQDLLESKMSLLPKERKSYVETMVWNKERYFLEDDLEYYLDEKHHFEIDITVLLIKYYFKDRLSEAEFNAISKDKNFIEGVFVSNKMEINFQ